MTSEEPHSTAEEVQSPAASCSDGNGDTAEQMKQTTATASVKAVVHCTDCKKKFGSRRMLHRHKRKSCPESSWRFFCRECKAYFPSKIALKNHMISVAHATLAGEKPCKSISASSLNSSGKKLCRRLKKSGKLKNRKAAAALIALKKGGKLRRKKRAVATCTVGSNPFCFTTSCAPDAQSFQFVCQSCLTVAFATYTQLREHEDWCARVPASQGFLCLPCGRHYRNHVTLRRHADEYHHIPPVSLEVKKVMANPFRFSTTVAEDASKHPHVCSSCLVVCFTDATVLRRHEDWCGQCTSAKDGLKCNSCGRYFRTAVLLDRHTAADDCLKTNTAITAVDEVNIERSTEVGTSDSDAMQEAGPETPIHGVCPLCDVPFLSQYEKQIHFVTVHNLTSDELKTKQSVLRHSRNNVGRTQVTCLDCNLMFPSHLQLAQHKRVCTKQKKIAKVILPVTSASLASDTGLSHGKTVCSAENKNSVKKRKCSATSVETVSNSSAECKTQNEVVKDPAITRALLLKSAKFRNWIKHTGAKRVLLKADGELILLGEGDQKIPTRSGEPVSTVLSRDCQQIQTCSTGIKNSSKPDSSEKNSAVSSQTVDLKSQPTNSGSDMSIVSDKKVQLKTDKGMSSENKSLPTEDHLQPSSASSSSRVASDMSLESKTALACGEKTSCGVDEQRKSKGKRSLHDDVSDSDPKHSRGHEDKNSVVVKQVSVSLRRMTSDELHHSVPNAVDMQASAAKSEVQVSDVESSPEDTGEQLTLLEALQLVPTSSQLNHPSTAAARYRTRAATHARATSSKGGPTKNIHTDKDAPSLSTSGQKRLKLSAKTENNGNKTVEVESSDTKQFNAGSLPQKTTVEPVDDSSVRCVVCKTVFRTVRQIVDHMCAGE